MLWVGVLKEHPQPTTNFADALVWQDIYEYLAFAKAASSVNILDLPARPNRLTAKRTTPFSQNSSRPVSSDIVRAREITVLRSLSVLATASNGSLCDVDDQPFELQSVL